MIRVYECDSKKKAELTKLLEADPYADDSFARVGYKMKDGVSVGEDKEKTYVYISASEDFLKKADGKLKDLAKPAPEDVQKRVQKKIEDEEDTVAAGVSMFGD
ncbi:MAG TPA: hypothetical protein VLD37_00265 [Candidatus Bilamarchaeum sp.]|nr:hypothetical protein [Candidatus Bilamarchaeum sp.]